MPSSLMIPKKLWTTTLRLLRERSAGFRESGALFLGKISPLGERMATRAIAYHDLDDDRASEGFLEISEAAKHQLYGLLEDENLRLVAMVHTHPSQWVGLSTIDQANKISSKVGFWSIVLPNFGQQPWEIQHTGFHIREDHGWQQLDSHLRDQLFRVGG